MPRDRLRIHRLRRMEAVLEILRRRAAMRSARGEAVPPPLRTGIADFGGHLGEARSARSRPPRSAGSDAR